MANGKLAVFEIKSSRDRLDRLAGQLETYLLFFEQVTIVCAAKHLAGAVAAAPNGVGIWQVNDDGSMRVVRRARARRMSSKKNWVSFLPVDELRMLLRLNELRAVGPRVDLVRAIDSVPVKAVREYVLAYMKRRAKRIHGIQERRKETLRATAYADPLPRMAQYLAHFQQLESVAIPRKVAAL